MKKPQMSHGVWPKGTNLYQFDHLAGGHWTWGTGYRGALAKKVRFMFPNQFFRPWYEYLFVHFCHFNQFSWAHKKGMSHNVLYLCRCCPLEISIDTHKRISYYLECHIWRSALHLHLSCLILKRLKRQLEAGEDLTVRYEGDQTSIRAI